MNAKTPYKPSPATIAVYDVIAIGGGLAGLTAARCLLQAGEQVLVLEAQNRVGGRTFTQTLCDGTRFDLGAQWIGRGMTRMYELIDELGLHTFPQYNQGKKLICLGKKIYTNKNIVAALPAESRKEWRSAIAKIDALAKTVDIEDLTATPNAENWDRTSIEQWARQHFHTDTAYRLFRTSIRDLFSAELSDVSMLDFLYAERINGGFMLESTTEGGLLQDKIVEGAQAIAECLAAQLGDRVILGCPVREIEQLSDCVRVVTNDHVYFAKQIVVAIPLTQISRIEFKPALPRKLSRSLQKLRMGAQIKCFALYDRAFWRESGYTGELILDDLIAYDATSANGKHPGLVVLIGGDRAIEWSDFEASKRQQAVLDSLARGFGEVARHPQEYLEKDWVVEPWIEGGYGVYMPPGAMTASFEVPNLSEPIGAIHWAGSELATSFPGYMEGAIDSGERTAAEVLRALTVNSDRLSVKSLG
jgi:monoamine oxidase